MTDRLQELLEPIETAMFNCESYMASPMMSVAEGKKLLRLLKAALLVVEATRQYSIAVDDEYVDQDLWPQVKEFDALVEELSP